MSFLVDPQAMHLFDGNGRSLERDETSTRRLARSRSAVMQDALRYWLRHQAEVALVREYEAGYRRRPETRREVKAAEAAAVRLQRGEDW